MRNRLRKLILLPLGIALAAILLMVAAIAGFAYFKPSLLKQPLESAVSLAIGREFRIDGAFEIAPSLTPRVTAGHFHVADASWSRSPYLLQGERLVVALSLTDLLHWRARLPLVRLRGAVVSLERSPDGESNWRLGRSEAGMGLVSVPSLSGIQSLELENVTVVYNRRPDKPYRAEIRSAFASVDAATGIQASLSALVQGRPLTLEVVSEVGAMLAAPGSPFPLHAELQGAGGQMRVEGSVGWPLIAAPTSLQVHVEGASFRELGEAFARSWPDFGAYALSAEFVAEEGRMALDRVAAELDQSQVTGDLSVATSGARSFLDAKLNVDRVVAVDLRPPADGSGAPPARVPDLGFLRRLDARLDVSVGVLELRGHRLENLRVEAHLDGGMLDARLRPVGLFADDLATRLRLDGSGEVPGYRLEARAQGLRLGDLLDLLGSRGVLRGKVREASLDVRGRLGEGDPLDSVDALALALAGAKLDLNGAKGERVPLVIDKAALGKAPASGRLEADLHGVFGSHHLDLSLGFGTLRELYRGCQQPLSIRLATDAGRAAGKGQMGLGDEGLRYQAELEAETEDLQALGRELAVGLPFEGPARAKAQVSGGLERASIEDAELILGDSRLTGSGELRFGRGGARYTGKLRLASDSSQLLARLLDTDLPPLGPWTAAGELAGEGKQLELRSGRLVIDTTEITGAGSLRLAPAAPSFKGHLELKADRADLLTRILAPMLPAVGPVTGQLELEGVADRLDLRLSRLAYGESRFSAGGSVSLGGSTPRIEMQVVADRLQLNDFVGPLEFAQQASPGRVIPDLEIRAKVPQWLDGRLELDVHRMLSGTYDLGSHVYKLSARGGTLEVDGKIAAAYLSEAQLSARLSAVGVEPALDITAKLTDLDYGSLLRLLDVEQDVEGKCAVELHFSGAGGRLPQLLANGEGSVDIKGGKGRVPLEFLRVWGGDLATLLIPESLKGGDESNLSCLAARFILKDGELRSDGMVLDDQNATLGGVMGVELPSEKLEAVFQPKPKRASLISLDTPVYVTGDLANPRVKRLTADAVLDLGKLVAGVYVSPVALVTLFGSMGTADQNPCEAVFNAKAGDLRGARRAAEKAISRPLQRLLDRLPDPGQ